MHASTGFTPFYLMMGRHPRLPIDSLFDFEGSDCSNTNVQEYVTEHFEKMKAAYRKAGERLEREAANRKELYDVKASEQKLDPGTLVFLRNHVKGRNKIQDKWNSKYYKIIKCIDSDRHVYLIEPSDKSGPSLVENRTNLQPCRFKERYTSDNDSDSTDDDSIAIAYPGFRTLRRTVRSTAYKHSNIHHEPRSVLP